MFFPSSLNQFLFLFLCFADFCGMPTPTPRKPLGSKVQRDAKIKSQTGLDCHFPYSLEILHKFSQQNS